MIGGDAVEILVEPKNALIKQYKKFFELEDVERGQMLRVRMTKNVLDGGGTSTSAMTAAARSASTVTRSHPDSYAPGSRTRK